MSWHTEPELRNQKRHLRFDTAAIANIDLRRWLDWRTFSRARRGEWHGACPKCGGQDRFILQERVGYRPKVACRQCTGTDAGRWMDAIAFMQWLQGCDFVEACRRLQLRTIDTPAITKPRKPQPGTKPDSRLAAIARHCADRLDDAALEYLRGRGIDDDMARGAGLGVSKGDVLRGVFVPAGLTIPCRNDDAVAYIKVRTKRGYKQVKGGRSSLYRAPLDSSSGWAIVTETELDALMLSSVADAICFATGSVSWNIAAAGDIARRHKLVTAFDNDDAGREAAVKWRAPKLSIPADCKDIGEVFQQRGAEGIRAILVAAGVPIRNASDCAVSSQRPRSRDMPQNRATGLVAASTGNLAIRARRDRYDLDTPKIATGADGYIRDLLEAADLPGAVIYFAFEGAPDDVEGYRAYHADCALIAGSLPFVIEHRDRRGATRHMRWKGQSR